MRLTMHGFVLGAQKAHVKTNRAQRPHMMRLFGLDDSDDARTKHEHSARARVLEPAFLDHDPVPHTPALVR